MWMQMLVGRKPFDLARRALTRTGRRLALMTAGPAARRGADRCRLACFGAVQAVGRAERRFGARQQAAERDEKGTLRVVRRSGHGLKLGLGLSRTGP